MMSCILPGHGLYNDPRNIVQDSVLPTETRGYCWVNMCSKVSPIDPVISSSPFFFGSMGKGVTLKSYHQWLDSDVSEVSGATLVPETHRFSQGGKPGFPAPGVGGCGEKLTGSPDTRKDSGAGTLKPKWHRTFATFATSS